MPSRLIRQGRLPVTRHGPLSATQVLCVARMERLLELHLAQRQKAEETFNVNRAAKRPLVISSVLVLLILCTHAHATPRPRLSAEAVQQLAVAALENAHLSVTRFRHDPPKFDSVTRVWIVKFTRTLPSYPETFNVFVFDATSHTEVTCLGMTHFGPPLKLTELPREVRPFVPAGESATDVVCADFNGTGQAGYILVSRKENGNSVRTLQVLSRQPDHRLSSVVRNANLIQPTAKDFMGGYEVIARTDRIEVVNRQLGSGGGDIWTLYFQWSPQDATWLLSRVDKTLVGPGHAEDDIAYVQRPADFGRITIAQFDFDKFER